MVLIGAIWKLSCKINFIIKACGNGAAFENKDAIIAYYHLKHNLFH